MFTFNSLRTYVFVYHFLFMLSRYQISIYELVPDFYVGGSRSFSLMLYMYLILYPNSSFTRISLLN